MLEPLDYAERDQAFAFIGHSLADFVPEDHVLRRLELAIDLRRLCTPFRDAYTAEIGRPAVHPEVLIRALIVGRVYDIASFRQLCRDLSYNLAYRYFCHLPLHTPVFDHSTISRFLERIGRPAFERLCQELNQWLTEAGLVSNEGYLDSTLIAANASSDGLRPTSASPEAFATALTEANGLFEGPAGLGPDAQTQVYQDATGRLPLPGSDPDARWGKGSRGPALLSYKVSTLCDDNGFITGHRLDLANVSDHVAGMALLATVPAPASLAADKAYSAGEFRGQLRSQGTLAYIPTPRGHPPAFLTEQGFSFNAFALICAEGQSLKATAKREKRVHYRAQRRLCGPCDRLAICPAAGKYGFTLGEDAREVVLAVETNRSPAYRRALRRRRCVAEGSMASLERHGLEQLRHRGLERVGILVGLTVLTHNLLRLLAMRPPKRPGAGAANRIILVFVLLYRQLGATSSTSPKGSSLRRRWLRSRIPTGEARRDVGMELQLRPC